jgi:hypothetical protein
MICKVGEDEHSPEEGPSWWWGMALGNQWQWLEPRVTGATGGVDEHLGVKGMLGDVESVAKEAPRGGTGIDDTDGPLDRRWQSEGSVWGGGEVAGEAGNSRRRCSLKAAS